MKIEFTGRIWSYQGANPWHFVTVPKQHSHDLKEISGFVTKGWGTIPVNVRIGKTGWKTSLFPKDGHYDLPIKASVRKAEHLQEGDEVMVQLEVL